MMDHNIKDKLTNKVSSMGRGKQFMLIKTFCRVNLSKEIVLRRKLNIIKEITIAVNYVI